MGLMDRYFCRWRRPGTEHALAVGGLDRSYVVHAPKGLDPATPAPVVLALHGATMNGPMMAWFSGLNHKADEGGFLAVYPNGTGERSSFTWNGGNCCGAAMQNQVDDVAFIDAMLDELARHYPVDPRRVYATGMSNGGIMAYRLAAELSTRIAAIAPVAGSLETDIGRLERPVSVLHFHGTDDEFVPFTGGRGTKSISATSFRSVEESIRIWVTANGCKETPIIDVLTAGSDGMRVTRRTYVGAPAGAEVVLVIVEGGGHTWPGRRTPAKILGRSTLAIAANDLMWDFFQRHPLDR